MWCEGYLLGDNLMAVERQRYEVLARAALDTADWFDGSRECSCDDSDGGWPCWYHQTDEQQAKERMDYIVEAVASADEDFNGD